MKAIPYYDPPNHYYQARKDQIAEEKRCSACTGFGFIHIQKEDWGLCLKCFGTGQKID